MLKVTPLLSGCLSHPDSRFLNHWATEGKGGDEIQEETEHEKVLGGSKSSTKQHRWKKKGEPLLPSWGEKERGREREG